MSAAVSNRINDLTSVLQTTEDHSVIQLQDIAMELDTWKTKVGGRDLLKPGSDQRRGPLVPSPPLDFQD